MATKNLCFIKYEEEGEEKFISAVTLKGQLQFY